MGSKWGLLLPGIGLFIAQAPYAGAASFDCGKAATTVEITICADEQIGLLDERMANAYRVSRERASDPRTLVAEQRAWLAERNACRTKPCLTRLYAQRIADLEGAARSMDAAPSQVASAAPTSLTLESPARPAVDVLDDAVGATASAQATDGTEAAPTEAQLEATPPSLDASMPAQGPMTTTTAEGVPAPASPTPAREPAPDPPAASAIVALGDAAPNVAAANGSGWWRDYLPRPGERIEDTYRRHPTFYKWLAGYVLVSGLFGLALVRPPLMRWYRSQFWLVTGTGPVDILFRKIGFRLGFEFFIYTIACAVGAVGGWLLVIIVGRAQRTGSSPPSVAITGNG